MDGVLFSCLLEDAAWQASNQDASRDQLSPEVDDAQEKADLVPHQDLLWLQLPGCQLFDTVSQRWPASCGGCCAPGCIISGPLHGSSLHVIVPHVTLPACVTKTSQKLIGICEGC